MFSAAVVDEFEFCPGFPASAATSRQKAEAAKANANNKLLKRTIFMLMDYPPVGNRTGVLRSARKWINSSGDLSQGNLNRGEGRANLFYHHLVQMANYEAAPSL
jgi:hypothetical protein